MAVQCSLGQNVVVGSMLVLQVALGNVPRGVWLDPRLLYNCTVPRFGVELPVQKKGEKRREFHACTVAPTALLMLGDSGALWKGQGILKCGRECFGIVLGHKSASVLPRKEVVYGR